jgi:hypothetical protein
MLIMRLLLNDYQNHALPEIPVSRLSLVKFENPRQQSETAQEDPKGQFLWHNAPGAVLGSRGSFLTIPSCGPAVQIDTDSEG